MKWLNKFVGLEDVYPYPIYQHQSSIQSYSTHTADSIFEIALDMPGKSDHTHMNGVNQIDVFIYA